MITLSAAIYGVHNPALLILHQQGFEIRVEVRKKKDGSGRNVFFAQKGKLMLVGDSGPELLGLAEIWNKYGDEWNSQREIMADVIQEVELSSEDESV